MKKLLTLVFTFFTLLVTAQWWDSERVEGNGKIEKISRPVGTFSSISSAGSFNVEITFGKSGNISIEGEENILDYIESKVEDNRLMLRYKKNVNIRTNKKITVYVAMTKVVGISLSGSGNIKGTGDFGNEGNTEFKISGSGNIYFDFDRIKNSSVAISGSGNITLRGKGESVAIKVSGSGDVDCTGLIANDAEVSISGSGNAKVHADEALEISISGSGNVSYAGNAKDIVKHTAGSGKVRRI